MPGVLGTCQIEDCEEPAAAQVLMDQERLDDDDKVVDYWTQLVALCVEHAVEELGG